MAQPILNLEFLEQDADVDVEALMTRIRERAQADRAANLSAPPVMVRAPDQGDHIFQEQAEFNHALVESLRALAACLGGLETAQTQERIVKLFERLELVTTRVQESESARAQELEIFKSHVRAALTDLDRQLRQEIQSVVIQVSNVEANNEQRLDKLARLETEYAILAAQLRDKSKRNTARIHQVKAQLTELSARVDGAGARIMPEQKPVLPSFDYFQFEQHFRGTRDDIQQRQRAYLDFFRDRHNVLDLGCGRGEFVELLAEQGLQVTGVELNRDMFEACRERGLRVVHADMFSYLESLPDASVDGLFAAQIIEHFPPEQILMLLSLCARKLEAGGVVVIETVNPLCLFALSNFFLDPTHVRPVPPQLLALMLEQVHVTVETFRFSAPVHAGAQNEIRVDKNFWQTNAAWYEQICFYQDYAVIARLRA